MKPIIFPTLETPRLYLREVVAADAADLFQFFADPEVMRHYGRPPMRELKEAEQLIGRFRSDLNRHSGVRWGLVSKESNRLIGTCGFYAIDKFFFSASIGYELARPYWRQGLMSEALEAVLRHGYSAMHLNRIQATTNLDNLESMRFLGKLGFKEEGILRQFGFWEGRFHDVRCFSLLKEEAML